MEISSALVGSSKSEIDFVPIQVEKAAGKWVTIKLPIESFLIYFGEFELF